MHSDCLLPLQYPPLLSSLLTEAWFGRGYISALLKCSFSQSHGNSAISDIHSPNLFKWSQKIKLKSKSALNFYGINKYFSLALASWLTFQ